MQPCNVVVLISGSGSNLQALIDDVRASPRDFIGRPKSKELEVQP